MDYLHKSFAVDQAVAKYDASNVWYKQPPRMILQQYADAAIAKSSKVPDAYDESTIIDVFVKGLDSST